MATDELDNVVTTVADRFNWDWRLIDSTPMSVLIKWYDRAVRLSEHESKLNGKQADNVG